VRFLRHDTTTAHAWAGFADPSVSFRVKEELHKEVRPAVISHGYDQGFHSEFIWQGNN
jgi:hypothetical protein